MSRILLPLLLLFLVTGEALAQRESPAYTELLRGRRNIYRVTTVAATPLFAATDTTRAPIRTLAAGTGLTAYEAQSGMVAVATYEEGAIGWVKAGTVTVGSTADAQLAASIGASDPAAVDARRTAEGARQGLMAYILGGAFVSVLMLLAFSAF